MVLDAVERWAKVFALVVSPLLVVTVPQTVSCGLREREMSLRFTELALDILRDSTTTPSLRTWAVSVIESGTKYQFEDELREDLEGGAASLPPDPPSIRSNTTVSVGGFLDTATGTGQAATEDEMTRFVNSALHVLSQSGSFSHEEEWDIVARGGRVFIYRTRDEDEFERALAGVNEVLGAVLERQDVDGISIQIRGMQRFYDIQGIPGVSGRAWIGFDLR